MTSLRHLVRCWLVRAPFFSSVLDLLIIVVVVVVVVVVFVLLLLLLLLPLCLAARSLLFFPLLLGWCFHRCFWFGACFCWFLLATLLPFGCAGLGWSKRRTFLRWCRLARC